MSRNGLFPMCSGASREVIRAVHDLPIVHELLDIWCVCPLFVLCLLCSLWSFSFFDAHNIPYSGAPGAPLFVLCLI